MAYPSLAIANAFIEVARQQDQLRSLTPMKLLKLVYFAHGWYLGVKGEKLINDPVEAWQYGPVVPAIYDAAKHYGNSCITAKLSTPFGDTPEISLSQNPEIADLVHWIWGQYGKFSGIALSNHTHEKGTPWSQVVDAYGGVRFVPRGQDIDPEIMRDFFHQEYQKLTAAC